MHGVVAHHGFHHGGFYQLWRCGEGDFRWFYIHIRCPLGHVTRLVHFPRHGKFLATHILGHLPRQVELTIVHSRLERDFILGTRGSDDHVRIAAFAVEDHQSVNALANGGLAIVVSISFIGAVLQQRLFAAAFGRYIHIAIVNPAVVALDVEYGHLEVQLVYAYHVHHIEVGVLNVVGHCSHRHQ